MILGMVFLMIFFKNGSHSVPGDAPFRHVDRSWSPGCVLGRPLAHFGTLLVPLGALLAHFAIFWVGFANAEATFSSFFCLLPSFQHFLEFSTKIAFKIYVSFEICHALAPESAQHQRQNQQARKTVAP